ncbi:alpha/beta hydrolase [Mesorhizobium caraganae]|uniref:alpha/beta hydrolase n=1 Tax=Mesorhizobium caraganae TaxID=483206 RepID=UPI0035E3F097
MSVPLRSSGRWRPSHGLDSLAGDVAAAKSSLGGVGSPAILVGHSYGGSLITHARADPRVAGWFTSRRWRNAAPAFGWRNPKQDLSMNWNRCGRLPFAFFRPLKGSPNGQPCRTRSQVLEVVEIRHDNDDRPRWVQGHPASDDSPD